VGSGLTLDRVHFTIVGVMPPGFFGAEVGTKPDIWVPLWTSTQLGEGGCMSSRSCWWLIVMARLKAGVLERQAQAVLAAMSPQVMREAVPPNWSRSAQRKFLQWQLFAVPGANGWTFLRTRFSNPLAILMILVALVLLIACANLANLLLARSSARQREIAVRLAIGAGCSRIIRQLLTESLLLSVAGAFAGLLFARWATSWLVAYLRAGSGAGAGPGFGQNTVFDLDPDWRILLFATLAALASALLFGLAPAVRATRVGISESLKERVHNVRIDETRLGIGRWLLVLQAALSVLLVAGAGLFAGSLFHLLTLNPGFETNNVTVIGIDTSKPPEKDVSLIRLYSQILERVNAIPGVRAASLLWFTPLSDSGWDDALEVPGRTDLTSEQRDTDINLVGPQFFEVMGIPLMAGRDFGETDNVASEKTGILNELAAGEFFPHANPIGAHVFLPGPPGGEKTAVRIIGVAGNAKYVNLREPNPRTLYLTYSQYTDGLPSLSFVIKTRNSAASYASFRAALHEIAPDVPIGFVKTMRQQVADSLGRERLMASLSSFFGVLALLLTSIGLYGILSYAVARRTGEIGVRIALGARERDVIWLVLRETVGHVTAGVGIGIVAALSLSKLVASLLYGIRPNDPGNLILAVVVFAAIAMLASYLPARRAGRLDPMRALREE